MRRWLGVTAAVSVLAVARPLRAQDAAVPVRAPGSAPVVASTSELPAGPGARLTERGAAARMRRLATLAAWRGEWAVAAERYEQCYRLGGGGEVLRELAIARRALGYYALALEAYRSYLREGRPGANDRTDVERAIHQIETGGTVEGTVPIVTLEGQLLFFASTRGRSAREYVPGGI